MLEKKQSDFITLCENNEDLVTLIIDQLDDCSLKKLNQTCTSLHNYTLFSSTLNHGRKLLHYIFQALPRQVKKCLKESMQENKDNWKWILQQTSSREPCGRAWQSISPLEFSAWIGDFTMVALLIKFIPNEKLPFALLQLKKVRENGLEYGECMAPFLELADACKHYDSEQGPTCVEFIGGLQYRLSSFGIQWLCDQGSPTTMSYPKYAFDFNRSPDRGPLLLKNQLDGWENKDFDKISNWDPYKDPDFGKKFYLSRWTPKVPGIESFQEKNIYTKKVDGDSVSLIVDSLILGKLYQQSMAAIDNLIEDLQLTIEKINAPCDAIDPKI